MKLSQLVLISIATMMPLLSFAQKDKNHGVGNGGGVICINGNCKTLADSGLKVDLSYPDFWLPDNALHNEVIKQVNQFPFLAQTRKALVSRIFLNLTHFKKVDVIDQVKLDEIIQFYKDTLLAGNPELDLTNFKLAAISSDESSDDPHTFILPSFFQLDIRTKAKILIHEGVYRGQKNSVLRQVIQLESALSRFDADYLHTVKDITVLTENIVNAQIALVNLGLITRADFFVEIMYASFSKSIENYVANKNQSYDKGVVDIPTFESIFIVDFFDGPLVLDGQSLISSSLDIRVKAFLLNLDFSKSNCNGYASPYWMGFIFQAAQNQAKIYTKSDICDLGDMSKQKFVLPN